MTTEFKVFHGVGAVIAQVTSPTKFLVYAVVDDGNVIDFLATERMFAVDLRATPGIVQAFSGSAIKFDDVGLDKKGRPLGLQPHAVSFPRGMGTTLGCGSTGDMTAGRFVGTVYVEQEHFNVLRKTAIDPRPWPPTNTLSLYQITSVAYSLSPGNGLRAGHRYHGHRGEVVEVTDTHFYVVFESRDGAPRSEPCKFTLDDVTQYDTDPPGEAIGDAPSLVAGPITKGAKGALFVALPFSAELDLIGGKLPIGLEI